MKNIFAYKIVLEIKKMQKAHSTAFPNKPCVNQFLKELEKISKSAEKILDLEKDNPFVKALLSVTSKAITEKNYSSIDMQDIAALTKVTIQSAQHERFFNEKRGPDSRLSKEAACLIAKEYKIIFKQDPGIGGEDCTEIGGNIRELKTQLQRVCDLVSSYLEVRIGRAIQRKAIQNLQDDKQTLEFFRPDVRNLPKKKIN